MRNGISGFTLAPTSCPPCVSSLLVYQFPANCFSIIVARTWFQALLSALYPIVSPALLRISLPTLSPAFFPTLSPTLSQTLSPTLSLTCVLLLRLQLFQGFTRSSLSACFPLLRLPIFHYVTRFVCHFVSRFVPHFVSSLFPLCLKLLSLTMCPSLSPALFPSLSPTLSSALSLLTLSPTVSPNCVSIFFHFVSNLFHTFSPTLSLYRLVPPTLSPACLLLLCLLLFHYSTMFLTLSSTSSLTFPLCLNP